MGEIAGPDGGAAVADADVDGDVHLGLLQMLGGLRFAVVGVLHSAGGHQFGADVDGEGVAVGPLAGLASCMRTATTPYIALVPCDSPLVCSDVVPRLHAALSASDARIAAAHDGEWLQPVFALLERDLRDDLVGFLGSGGRKIGQWYEEQGYVAVDFSDVIESFANINAPDDKRALEDKLAERDKADGRRMT